MLGAPRTERVVECEFMSEQQHIALIKKYFGTSHISESTIKVRAAPKGAGLVCVGGPGHAPPYIRSSSRMRRAPGPTWGTSSLPMPLCTTF